MKTVLITGAKGQLGRSLEARLNSMTEVKSLFTDVDDLDICNKEAITAFMEANSVNYIINCAAYTAVDKAEEEEIVCFRLNRDAVRNIGEAATRFNAKIIHISTDYVFDGTNSLPYVETDYTCPVSAYGRSKQQGELILRAVCSDAIIIRTSWLYSEYGNNFVRTMMKLAKEKDELNVVFDQIGTPTYAADLAEAILGIIKKAETEKFYPGIYHFSNEGVGSWYDFARKIFELAGLDCKVNPINTKNYPSRASRPQFSVLDKGKIKKTFGLQIPHWEDSLKRMMQNIS
ncbi:MAG: dTDP-4-dehydrorhamnose reductase [Tannerellaceae bacterium]|nr:dTDP-4-dehydrorhamnose reductase [Tannerellaceae bacterium]